MVWDCLRTNILLYLEHSNLCSVGTNDTSKILIFVLHRQIDNIIDYRSFVRIMFLGVTHSRGSIVARKENQCILAQTQSIEFAHDLANGFVEVDKIILVVLAGGWHPVSNPGSARSDRGSNAPTDRNRTVRRDDGGKNRLSPKKAIAKNQKNP